MTAYWLDSAKPFASGTQGGSSGNADVAVIGAGFTGLSAALSLAKKGAKVVVLEADHEDGAASGRNGGMCNNGIAQDYGGMVEKFGAERANMLYRAFDAGVDLVEQIVTEEGIDCHFGRVGKRKLAAKPEHFEKIKRSQELLARNVDAETSLVMPQDLPAEIGSGTSPVGPLGWFRRRLVPVGAYLIATEPLPVDLLDRLTPRRRNTVDTRNFVSYFRTTPDNLILFGGRARFSSRSDPAADAKSGAILRRSMMNFFPELADARIDYCWGGMVDMTGDRLPRAASARVCSIRWATGATAPTWQPTWGRSWPRCSMARPRRTLGAISIGRRSRGTSGRFGSCRSSAPITGTRTW